MSTRSKRPENDRDRLAEKLRGQRPSLAKTGVLSLRDLPVASLKSLSTQPRLHTLDVSNTGLQSLESLTAQPTLAKIVADNSQLASFEGLDRHPHLVELSAIGTPLAARENFRIEALVVVGSKLSQLNGAPVKTTERELAKTFPKIVKHLLEFGWALDLSILDEGEYRQIAAQLGVRVNGRPFDKLPSADAKALFATPPVYVRKSRRDEALEAKEFKEEVVEDAKREEEKAEAALLAHVADLLEGIQVFVDRGDGIKDDLLNALQGLTDVVRALETATEPSPEEDAGDDA